MANKQIIVCDTNILVYFFEGNKEAGKVLNINQVIISSITFIEILSNKNIPAFQRNLIYDFLRSLSIVETNPVINKIAAEFRLLYGLDTADPIIAATAKYQNNALATADKIFYKIKEIEIIKFSKK
jgi:predicted nucleic acid-binding protein